MKQLIMFIVTVIQNVQIHCVDKNVEFLNVTEGRISVFVFVCMCVCARARVCVCITGL